MLNIYAKDSGHTAYSAVPIEALSTENVDLDATDIVGLHANDNVGLHANWGKRLETVAATTSAVSVVAIIALLLGMPGQPRNSYQATFNSMEACQKARVDVVAEVAALKAEEEQRAGQMRAAGAFINLYSVPHSFAELCAAQQ